MLQLESLEQRLLLHDPTFTDGDTHAALTNRRSALISAFRPDYPEGDIEGPTSYLISITQSLADLIIRAQPYPSQCGKVAHS